VSDNIPREPTRDDYRDGRNPFGDLPATRPVGAIANAEQQRSIAEVQARMIIARSNPRDPRKCMDLILQDCTRPTLAEKSLYQYSKGGSSISGPSIRLAEAIAQRWGNIASGIKEMSRAGGYSECVAYAWDLETGFYDERQYQVRHWRDTRQGGHPITDEREIYELIANYGQRRKRAVLLTVIPGDVTEAAQEQCEATLHTTADTSPEALARMAAAFEQFGVTKTQIEKRCQCRLEAIRPAQVVQLRKIFASLKDEMSEPSDWFDAPNGAWAELDKRHAATQAATSARQSEASPASTTTQAATPANGADLERDTAGIAWDANLHSANKSRNKDGTWRQRRGVETTQSQSAEPEGDSLPFDRWNQEAAVSGKAAEAPASPPAPQTQAISPTPPANPTQAAPEPFEAWLIDGEGEVIAGEDGPGEKFTNPVDYARAYVDAVNSAFPPDREGIIKANQADVVQAQIVSMAVPPILAGIKPSQTWTSASDTPTKSPYAIDAPKTFGKADMDAWMKKFQTMLDAADDMEGIGIVHQMNEMTIGTFPPPKRNLAKSMVQKRQTNLNPQADASRQPPAERILNALLKDLVEIKSEKDLDAWFNHAAIKHQRMALADADVNRHDEFIARCESMRQDFIKNAPPAINIDILTEEIKEAILGCKTKKELRDFNEPGSESRRKMSVISRESAMHWTAITDLAQKQMAELPD
jgi:hypothetical protein